MITVKLFLENVQISKKNNLHIIYFTMDTFLNQFSMYNKLMSIYIYIIHFMSLILYHIVSE